MVSKLKSIYEFVHRILYILNNRQRFLLTIVLLFSLVNAGLQMLGVSIIVPLVSALTDIDGFERNKYVILIEDIFNISDSSTLIILVCLLSIIVYLIKDAFSIINIWVSSKFAIKVKRELSVTILEEYLNKEYDFFLYNNTTQILRDIESDPNGVYLILNSGFVVITEGLTMMLILAYILLIDFKMALCILLIAALCLAIIFVYFKRKMYENGKKARKYSAETRSVLLQIIEGIKEVKVFNKQQYFINAYNDRYFREQKPNIFVSVGSLSPTFIVEALFVLGLLGYICICFLLDPNYISAVPMLASVLMAAIRLLPSIGRVSTNINTISANTSYFQTAYDNISELRRETASKTTRTGVNDILNVDTRAEIIHFQNELQLCDIGWHYKDSNKYVLKSLNLSIHKGECIGVIGASGAGKSTFADIILGLHVPQEGQILLDGADIRGIPEIYGKIIGFVPQSIYLTDGNIRDNVAFGIDSEEVDDNRVWECLRQAQIDDFIRGLENGIETLIGERGIRFSGGQRQRIAIARALYRQPEILILDEATSALDNETEAEVMCAIEGLYGKMTMVIIAHRLTTVAKCDKIFEIDNGQAKYIDKSDLFGTIH